MKRIYVEGEKNMNSIETFDEKVSNANLQQINDWILLIETFKKVCLKKPVNMFYVEKCNETLEILNIKRDLMTSDTSNCI